MTGDLVDMVARLRAVLPPRWFSDTAPVLEGVLAGIAEIWARMYALLEAVRRQTRMATAEAAFLDMISADLFGLRLRRRGAEGDVAFRGRILREILRERGTRAAVISALLDLTGRMPLVFEPARPADTGGWQIAAGYGVAGGWGSLLLPHQCFVTALRPAGQGIGVVAGWDVPVGGWGVGNCAYGSLAEIVGRVTDADIAAAVAQVMPAATIAWLRIAS